jgi:lysophospholipase L1-like esterase
MKVQLRRFSIRWILSWLLILGLFLELTLRALTAWKEPRGRFTWMLGRNRLEVMAERDGYRFFTGRKGQDVSYGPMNIQFNDLGYRSSAKEVLPKEEDLFRVICLGDSVTFGQYARDYYDTWPGALERILGEYPTEKRVEVLNFGMAHYTYTTNLVNLALTGEYLQPDMVIYLIGPNDFVCLYARDYAPDGSHDGQWLLPVADATWGFHPIGDILKHSRVCNLIYGTGVKILLLLDASKHVSYRLTEESLPPRLEKMGLHLTSLCSFSRALGAQPVFCTYLYDEERLRRKRGEDFPSVLEQINETVREVVRLEDAILVEANQEMKDHSEFFMDDFHLTPEGGSTFARLVIQTLERRGVLPLKRNADGRQASSPPQGHPFRASSRP